MDNQKSPSELNLTFIAGLLEKNLENLQKPFSLSLLARTRNPQQCISGKRLINGFIKLRANTRHVQVPSFSISYKVRLLVKVNKDVFDCSVEGGFFLVWQLDNSLQM